MHTPALKNKRADSSNKIFPKKSLGQNFLRSRKITQQIIKAADIKTSDIIIEIGPGLGALTLALAEKAKRVIAIEKDRKIAEILNKNLSQKGISNVEVINEDILHLKSEIRNSKFETNYKFKILNSKQRYKLVANLPYNIATAVIMKFLEAKNQPELMVVMVQKEVGQRICAKHPHTNKLAIFTQLYGQPKIIGYVSKKYFYPQPKVDGAILKIIPKVSEFHDKPIAASHFSRIVNAGFSQPRKQLINNLSGGLNLDRETVIDWLNKNNIKPSQRAESLTIADWQNLSLQGTEFLAKKIW